MDDKRVDAAERARADADGERGDTGADGERTEADADRGRTDAEADANRERADADADRERAEADAERERERGELGQGDPQRGENEPAGPKGEPLDPALAEAAAEAAREALAQAEPPEAGDPQAGELPELSPALLDMAAGMIRSLDAESLQSLAELAKDRAEDPGQDAQPPTPPPGLPPGAEELLERLSEEDLRKLGQAFAGMQRDGLGEGAEREGERPTPRPELAERLSELDPALLERMQRAMAGIEPPRDGGAGASSEGVRADGGTPQRGSSAPGAASGSGRTGAVAGGDSTGAPRQGAELADAGSTAREGGPKGRAGPSVGSPGAGGRGEAGATAPAGDGPATPHASGRPGGRGASPPGEPGDAGAADERHVLLPGRAAAGQVTDEDAPAARTRARVPLSAVPPAALEEALRALDRDPVPEGYERVVREYFRRWRAEAEAAEDAPADPPR